MKFKKLTAIFLTALIFITALSAGINAAALVMCETQYSYDKADMSWLKDLIIKEDMTSIGGLSKRNTYTPKAKYPYRETAASFKEEVAYYQALYTLDEDMANVIYLYMLELTKSFADSVNVTEYSDEFIKDYLESLGIVYPSGSENSEETKIVARALFALITNDEDFTVKRGTGLYEAFTDYFSDITGVNVSSIIKFDQDGNLTGLKEYVLAACRFMLYQAGYDVDKDTSEKEVYRLVAIMTIKAQGISIDSSTATFEEIKNKYLCAMIAEIYDVTIDTKSFDDAVTKDNLAFYLLQTIGKENGISVSSSLSYEDAFKLVCEKTEFFNLEEGEFYADIYEYDVKLDYKRDKIWIYPETMGVTSESDGTTVSVVINGEKVRENYYNQVSLDSSKSQQTVTIVVEYKDKTNSVKSSSYKLNIFQGTETPVANNTISDALSGMQGIVENVLGDMNFDGSLSEIVANLPFSLPERVLSIASLLMPKFDLSSIGGGFLQKLFGYSKDDDSNVNTDQIGGVGGLDSYLNSGSSSQSMNFNSFDINLDNAGQLNTNGTETTTNPANTLVIGNETTTNPQSLSVSGQEDNWFRQLTGDTKTIIVLVVALVVTFGACLALFLQIFKEKGYKKGKNYR